MDARLIEILACPVCKGHSNISATRSCSCVAWIASPIRSATKCRSCSKRKLASSRPTIRCSIARGFRFSVSGCHSGALRFNATAG